MQPSATANEKLLSPPMVVSYLDDETGKPFGKPVYIRDFSSSLASSSFSTIRSRSVVTALNTEGDQANNKTFPEVCYNSEKATRTHRRQLTLFWGSLNKSKSTIASPFEAPALGEDIYELITGEGKQDDDDDISI